ncbi:hypothetical protein JCM11641_002655 [Rhodosporidiobolus odoratus]
MPRIKAAFAALTTKIYTRLIFYSSHPSGSSGLRVPAYRPGRRTHCVFKPTPTAPSTKALPQCDTATHPADEAAGKQHPTSRVAGPTFSSAVVPSLSAPAEVFSTAFAADFAEEIAAAREGYGIVEDYLRQRKAEVEAQCARRAAAAEHYAGYDLPSPRRRRLKPLVTVRALANHTSVLAPRRGSFSAPRYALTSTLPPTPQRAPGLRPLLLSRVLASSTSTLSASSFPSSSALSSRFRSPAASASSSIPASLSSLNDSTSTSISVSTATSLASTSASSSCSAVSHQTEARTNATPPSLLNFPY